MDTGYAQSSGRDVDTDEAQPQLRSVAQLVQSHPQPQGDENDPLCDDSADTNVNSNGAMGGRPTDGVSSLSHAAFSNGIRDAEEISSAVATVTAKRSNKEAPEEEDVVVVRHTAAAQHTGGASVDQTELEGERKATEQRLEPQRSRSPANEDEEENEKMDENNNRSGSDEAEEVLHSGSDYYSYAYGVDARVAASSIDNNNGASSVPQSEHVNAREEDEDGEEHEEETASSSAHASVVLPSSQPPPPSPPPQCSSSQLAHDGSKSLRTERYDSGELREESNLPSAGQGEATDCAAGVRSEDGEESDELALKRSQHQITQTFSDEGEEEEKDKEPAASQSPSSLVQTHTDPVAQPVGVETHTTREKAEPPRLAGVVPQQDHSNHSKENERNKNMEKNGDEHSPLFASSSSLSTLSHIPSVTAAAVAVAASAMPPQPVVHTLQRQKQQQQLPASPSFFFKRSGFLPTYKVLVIGDAAVGKTNLLSRYCRDEYDTTAPPTIGIEFFSRQLEVPTGHVGESQGVVVQLWDTAGQERCSIISNAYYRNAVGAMLVYDVTRRESFLNLLRWAGHVRSLANEDCICVVVGNKTDQPSEQWAVSEVEGEQLAHTLDMRHYLASALSGSGVLHAFTQMVLAVNAVQSTKMEQAFWPVESGGGGGGGPISASASALAVLPAPTVTQLTGGGGSAHSLSASSSATLGNGVGAGGNASSPHHASHSNPNISRDAHNRSPISRSLQNSYFSSEENTLWTVPSTVPHGALSTEATPQPQSGSSSELNYAHNSEPASQHQHAGSLMHPSSSRTATFHANRSSPVLMSNGDGNGIRIGGGGGGGVGQRSHKKSLDLRGFGSRQPTEGSNVLGGGCGC